MKGTDETIKKLAQEGKFEELKKMKIHGNDVTTFKDK